MKTALLALAAGLALSTAAHADRMPIPADAPPAFKAECGSCHLPFPPALLSAPDWQKVMGGLDKHYGDNASLDEKTRRLVEDFLIRNAGEGRRVAEAGNPPRITATGWFRREHREVSIPIWKDKRVGSPANCAACHSKADQGSFREREIILPGGRRWED